MVEEKQSHWASHGATVQPVYTKWCPKVYVIPENQLKGLTHFNTQATVFFSVGSAFGATAVNILFGVAFEGIPTNIAWILSWIASPALGLLSIVFFALGWHSLATRKSILESIKDESEIIELPE